MQESVFKNQTAQMNSRAAAVERGFVVGDPKITDLNTQGGSNLQWYMPKKNPSPTK